MSLASFCQKAEWLVGPGRYSDIEYFAPNMYKVHDGDKIGIIDNTGKEILPARYDAVNLFYEGRAIFVNDTNRGWQVMGVLNEDGSVAYADGDYYVVPKFMFFSEGYLTVMDSRGYYGFLDENMKPAFDFTPNKVTPFSEGWAAVGEGDDFYWLTNSGEKILLRLPNGGTPNGGTCTYNGNTYTWDEDGYCFRIGGDGRISKISVEQIPDIDYQNRSGSNFGEEVPYERFTQKFDDTWMPEERNGQWSYISGNGKLLSPFQYDEVGRFSDNVAIASKNGRKGMLHIVADDATFYTSPLMVSQNYSDGDVCQCGFKLSIPDKWVGHSYTVKLHDSATGEVIPINNDNDNTYTFKYKPNGTMPIVEKTFDIEVSSNGIELWQGNESFRFVQRAKLAPFINVNNATANANDLCTVTATIKNPSGMTVTTTVTLSGGGKTASFNKRTVQLTIPPHSSRSVSSTFNVKKVELNGWVSVTTSDGTSSHRSNLELAPF